MNSKTERVFNGWLALSPAEKCKPAPWARLAPVAADNPSLVAIPANAIRKVI